MMLIKCSDNERQETGTHLENGEHSLPFVRTDHLGGLVESHLTGTELDERLGPRGASCGGSEQSATNSHGQIVSN